MVANLVSKRDPKIARNLRISWENWDFPSPKLRFSSQKNRFSSTAFQFPRNPRKSSSTAFRFLRRLSAFFNSFPIFFNGFPLSKKFRKIYLWRQVYKRLLSELRISAKIAIFRDKNNQRQEYKRSLIQALYFLLQAL
jgi:hypothetical protein